MAYPLRQEQIRKLLADFAAVHGKLTDLREIDRAASSEPSITLSSNTFQFACASKVTYRPSSSKKPFS